MTLTSKENREIKRKTWKNKTINKHPASDTCIGINEESRGGLLSASALKLLAILFMLLDHIWAAELSDWEWLTYIGRLSFPIFAFQIAEGYHHTSDVKRYARRLFVLVLLSEIPFNLIINGTVFYPPYQNVMFTLLLGLITISRIDKAKQEGSLCAAAESILLLLGCCFAATIIRSDYGAIGVLTIVIFSVFKTYPRAALFQLAALIFLNLVCFWNISATSPLPANFPVQGLAVLALLPIWLYNNQKGKWNEFIQKFAYAFYPLHLMVLFLLKKF